MSQNISIQLLPGLALSVTAATEVLNQIGGEQLILCHVRDTYQCTKNGFLPFLVSTVLFIKHVEVLIYLPFVVIFQFRHIFGTG